MWNHKGAYSVAHRSRLHRSGFSPTDLSGLQLWLDASDTDTIEITGSGVSQWDDKSGKLNHAAQTTDASRPGTGNNTQNSLNVLDFDDEYMTIPWVAELHSSEITTFAVARYTTVTGTSDGIITTREASNAGGYAVQFRTSSNEVGSLVEDGALDLSVSFGGGVTVLDKWEIIVLTHTETGPSSILYQDNTSVETDATRLLNYDANTDIVVGRNRGASGTADLKGDIAEIINYNRVLTSTERTQVYNYLNTKWILPVVGLPVTANLIGDWDPHIDSSLTFSGQDISQWDDQS